MSRMSNYNAYVFFPVHYYATKTTSLTTYMVKKVHIMVYLSLYLQKLF